MESGGCRYPTPRMLSSLVRPSVTIFTPSNPHTHPSNVWAYASDAHPSNSLACRVDGGLWSHGLSAEGTKDRVKRSKGLQQELGAWRTPRLLIWKSYVQCAISMKARTSRDMGTRNVWGGAFSSREGRGWKSAGRGKKERKSTDPKIQQKCVNCYWRICITVWCLDQGKHYTLWLLYGLSANQIITSCTKDQMKSFSFISPL